MADAVLDAPVATYSDFLAKGSTIFEDRGAPANGVVDTKAKEQPAADAKTAENPANAGTPEPASGSDPDQQLTKFEQRKAAKQREIDDITRKIGEAKRELESLDATRKAPASPAAASDPATAAAAAAAPKYDGRDPSDPEPDPTKFTGVTAYEDYLYAKMKWRERLDARAADFEKRQTAQAETQKAQKAEKDRLLKDFETAGSTYASEAGNEDYPALVENFRRAQKISPETEAAILYGGDHGPKLLHTLLKDPAELKRIEALPRPIDRLEALMEHKFKLKYADVFAKAEAAPPVERPRSQAPRPGTVLSGRGGAPAGNPKSLNEIGSLEDARKLVSSR